MDGSTNAPMYNGEHPAKPAHVFSTSVDAARLAQGQLSAYMGTYNGGGDPVTALGVRGTAAVSSVAKRQTDVVRCLQENVALYEQGSDSSSRMLDHQYVDNIVA
ncbi:hypothetical protein F5X97DRAFT_322573 [Nemania serpens]|nr:hypothetical protein F5X97DRAFT_322573 [Nemania serpens]